VRQHAIALGQCISDLAACTHDTQARDDPSPDALLHGSLKDRRNAYEYQALVRLADALPADIKVCIVADRGFGDHKLYRVLTEELAFDYVIRFRGNITVTAVTGEVRTAAAWVGPGGRARVLRGALVTAERYPVGTVVCVQDHAMKQAWCLATSTTDATAKTPAILSGFLWLYVSLCCMV